MTKVTDLTLATEALWGAKAIAAFLGVSADTVARWERDSTVPIFKRGGRYFALRSELWAWLRQSADSAA